MELLKTLKRLRAMIWVERMMKSFIVGLCVGSSLSFVVLLVNKFIYMNYSVNSAVAICFVTGGFFGILIGFFRFASYQDAAKLADRLGFKERFITALELSQKESTSEMERLQIQDAVQSGTELKGMYRLSMPIRELKIFAILAVLVFVAYFVPSPFAEQLQAQAKHQEEIAEQIKNLEAKTEEQLKMLTKKDAATINAQMRQAMKELRNAKNKAESIKAMEKAQAELKKAENNMQSKEMKELAEKLKSNEKTQALGETLESGDLSKLQKDVESLSKEIENASPKELLDLTELLEQIIAELEKDSELAKNLNEVAESLAKDNSSQVSESLEKLSSTLEGLAKENENLQQALKKLQETVVSSQNEMSGQNTQAQTKEPQQGAAQQGPAQQGGQPGQGSGNAGESGGNGRGAGHKENENIYAREAQGLKDYDTEIDGIQTENGETIEREQKVTGQVGELKPYSEVLNSYRQEALKELTDYQIPQGMRDLVKEYFSTLE